MTFAEYMEQALYGPEGYYASGRARSGKSGDYFTAPDAGPVFGELLTGIFADWQERFRLSPFHVVEVGAGEGVLAERIVRAGFSCTAIERSPARRKKLERLAAAHIGTFRVLEDVRELSSSPVEGCIFANELLDAFPVHRVRRYNGRLEEAYVEGSPASRVPRPESETRDPGRGARDFYWGSPSTPRLQAYFDRLGIDLPEGYETEINLAMADWFKDASAALSRGLAVLVDYGRPAREYFDSERREGTLRAFQDHRVGADILSAVGRVDLTADVDFTSAALDARKAGLVPLAFMEMGTFLLGGIERLAMSDEQRAMSNDRSLRSSASLMAHRSSLQYLLHPEGLGSAFQVLILGKGLPELSEKDFPRNRLRRLGLEELSCCR